MRFQSELFEKDERRPDAVLIAGPTASGKSAAALEIAEMYGGTIVNADSMQVYPVLRILTARPGADDLARVPHRLYGHASLTEAYSVAEWLADMRIVLDELAANDSMPVITGGTGLYFHALIKGLANIPDIPDEVRSRLRRRLKEEGAQALYAELTDCDPGSAATLRPTDSQRVCRALEVFQATGRSIGEFQAETHTRPPLVAVNVKKILIMPERNILRNRIDSRFDAMVAAGALDEVRELDRHPVPADHPVLKAIGVNQLKQFISGDISLQMAIEKSKTQTRQYAKRQSTWFRNRFDDQWQVVR